MGEVIELLTMPERMATLRCIDCGHQWQDLDAACSQYPSPCPKGCGFSTEPAYNPCDGKPMPEGWMALPY